MKKITLIILACITFCYSSYSQDCSSPLIAPFTEDFENVGVPVIPDCWTTSFESGNTNGELWLFADASDTGNSPGHVGDGGVLSGSSASNGYYAYCDASSTHGIRYLTSPMIDISSLTNPSISFYQLSDREDNINAGLTVEVWDGTAWVEVAFYATNTYNNAWEKRVIDISSVAITGDTQVRFVYNELGSGADDDIAIDDVSVEESPTCINPETPVAENITENSAELSWIYNGSATTFNVEIVDATAGGVFTGTATDTNVSYPYNATGLAPTNFYDYYVQANCTGGTSDWVGPLRFQTTILCFEPTAVEVANITLTSADVSWVDDASGTLDTQVEIGAYGFTPGIGAELFSGTSSTGTFSFTSLNHSTVYDVYVRTNCDASGISAWLGTTFCTNYTAPYTETFDNNGEIPLCWSMDGGEDWLFDVQDSFYTNDVGDEGTLYGETTSGTYFAYVDATGTQDAANLYSPFVDLSTLTTPALSFYEISYGGASANSTLTVEIWDGTAWNTVATYDTDTPFGWELKIIDLSGITFTGDAQVKFVFDGSSSLSDDIAIDDVSFIELPACLPPTTFAVVNTTETSADFSWVENNGSTAWEIVVQPIGTGTPTDSGNAATNNPYTYSSLSPGIIYEAYVRTNCGGSFSDWTGPIEFATQPTNDDCTNAIPLTVGAVFGDNPLDTSVAGATIGSETASCGNNGGGVWYSAVVPASGDLTFQTGDDSNAEYSGFDTFDSVIEAFSGTCGSLTSIECNDQLASSGTNYSQLELTGLTPGSTIYLRVWEIDDSLANMKPFAVSAFSATLNIDDFESNSFKYYPNPVKNTLVLNAQSIIDEVTVYNLLGQSVLKENPNSIESNLNMSNLQNGIYIVKVSIANTIKTIRVIKD